MTCSSHTYKTFARDFGLKQDAPLEAYTSFKVGGPADLLALPENKKTLTRLLKAAATSDIPVTLFGGGTNLLISDKGIRGLVVITRQMASTPEIKESGANHMDINVDAGCRLSALCRFALENSLGGLEFAAGIPGTVGGAIAMNAGTPDGQMSDIVQSVEVWNSEIGQFTTCKKETLKFSYRSLEVPGFIAGACIRLKKADKKEIEQRYQTLIRQKKKSQPVSFASAGCFFKNPPTGMPAGELIEKAGLKGKRVNDAIVSELHANYIVNLNAATCEDILALKQQIQTTVYKKFHINLETEVRVEGE